MTYINDINIRWTTKKKGKRLGYFLKESNHKI